MDVDLQIACSATNLPTLADFECWSIATLQTVRGDSETELTLRLVNNEEIQQLNHDYRGKNTPTNVLSFPFEPYDALTAYAGDVVDISDLNLLGDIIMAPAVIEEEAQAQNKSRQDHYAHMTVHGILHLLGYDHIKDDEAETMENLEIQILHTLGISNPYQY